MRHGAALISNGGERHLIPKRLSVFAVVAQQHLTARTFCKRGSNIIQPNLLRFFALQKEALSPNRFARRIASQQLKARADIDNRHPRLLRIADD